jgi:hypothetical protein
MALFFKKIQRGRPAASCLYGKKNKFDKVFKFCHATLYYLYCFNMKIFAGMVFAAYMRRHWYCRKNHIFIRDRIHRTSINYIVGAVCRYRKACHIATAVCFHLLPVQSGEERIQTQLLCIKFFIK